MKLYVFKFYILNVSYGFFLAVLVNSSVASRLNMIREHDIMICQVSITTPR